MQRLFVKCPHCSAILYTKHLSFADFLTKHSVICHECKKELACISLFLCDKAIGDECDCEFRFLCFTSAPAEEELGLS